MSQPSEILDVTVHASPPEEDSDDIQIEDVISAFLDVNPTPSDEQVHKLAFLLEMKPEDLEGIIYKMFGERVETEDVEDELEHQSDDSLDPIETLLLCYFAHNPEPSDQQIHHLAEYVGFTPAELEERLFSMLSDLDTDDESTLH